MNKSIELRNNFKKYIEESTVIVSSSTTNYRERCEVFFYEWSNTSTVPRKFYNSSIFFKFLEDCKINITDSQKKEFDSRYTFHATCFHGTNLLGLASSKVNLDTLINKYKGTIPKDYERTSYVGCYSGYNNYNGHSFGCGCYDHYDECWD